MKSVLTKTRNERRILNLLLGLDGSAFSCAGLLKYVGNGILSCRKSFLFPEKASAVFFTSCRCAPLKTLTEKQRCSILASMRLRLEDRTLLENGLGCEENTGKARGWNIADRNDDGFVALSDA